MKRPPIDILPLFPVLNEKLISFLRNLSPQDWQKETVARHWKVKDIVAHLLDGNYRQISVKRDAWAPPPDVAIESHEQLVEYLNRFNADWVKAAWRMSSALLIEQLEITNAECYEVFAGLDPFASSVYPVSWAGEELSQNWFDTAREYTERWLHQQQVRFAMHDSSLLTQELYNPCLQIFLQAWPFTCKNVDAPEGTVLKTCITGEGGGNWWLEKKGNAWKMANASSSVPAAETIIDGKVAWILFSKSVRKDDIGDKYEIRGNRQLGEKILDMISVMA
jgi:hypothetical protein